MDGIHKQYCAMQRTSLRLKIQKSRPKATFSKSIKKH
jgi:hypothetical protein